MPTVIVRHDLPIADALADRREDLTVQSAGTTDEARELLADADALVINPSSWTDELLEPLREGDWVQATSTGYSAFPVEEFEAGGVTFTNATGNYGAPVADHVFALALGLSRGVASFARSQGRGEWDRSEGSRLFDLEGRTMTVVGMGDIGENVARRALGFGMEVYGTKGTPDEYDGRLPSERVLAPDELDAVVDRTDLLALTVPLTEATRHLVDRETFAALPDRALLVNVARGPVVDQEALIDALESGEIAGAGLDVFDPEPLPTSSPLWGMENVIVTPHVGGRSRDFVDRFVDLFLHNYDRRRTDDPLRNRIA
ncbi:D-2-hydroxyacid dehydrogenase [Halorarum salinum]|uniref:D-2-hydroxyacid dehydrogenase n=1 Tax=Halorarum salinum TaxID=2743089 RepID=A0A7D5Q9F2_9EURY|nr:D-2-hydroxyacid dehydrogenase [Halobaculum salinum]QLG61736.1 D-2-hydroxyacid dehydrogenase [Halobaculum salinum]